MALNLTILKSPAGIQAPQREKTFSEAGGSIGRGDTNDWVLADPDRFLSSRHCQISFEGGQFYLTDTSTNGTFINGSPEPLGKGGKLPLNNGDSIELGDYQFRVEVDDGLGAFSDPFASSAPSVMSLEGDGPTQLEDDPFASPVSGNNDPFGNDPFGSDPFTPSADVSLSPDPLDVDPLAALDKATPAPGISGGGDIPTDFGLNAPAASDPFVAPEPFDGFANSSEQSHVTQGDSSNLMGDSLDWPEASAENMIPEDWDDDFLSGAPKAPPPQSLEPKPQNIVKPAARPKPKPEHRSLPLTDPPAAKIHSEPLLDERPPERVDAFKSKPVKPAKPKVPKVEIKEAASRRNGSVTQSIGSQLLDGMGLDPGQLDEGQIEDIHKTIGELMPVIITGMMQVLRARASIKNEFRMNVTTIQPIENNPLKFSANAQEAIDSIFVRKSSAYMDAQDAFQEGFDGIGEHQVAIIAGIRAAFKSMMERFDPQRLEKQFDRQNKGVVLPGMQKAKYWNSYSDYYASFIDNMENSFQYLFGDEFVQAYEEQLRRLAAERKQRR